MPETATKRKSSPAYTFSVVEGKPVHSLGASALKKLSAAIDGWVSWRKCRAMSALRPAGNAASWTVSRRR